MPDTYSRSSDIEQNFSSTFSRTKKNRSQQASSNGKITLPLSSSHICKDSSCVFHNLCLINGEYIYYATGYDSSLDLTDFLSRQPGNSLHFKSVIQENAEPSLPTELMGIRIEFEPVDKLVPMWPGNYTELHRYYSQNVGHTLGDDVFAIFQGLHSWGADTLQTNLHIFVDDTTSPAPFEIITKFEIRHRPEDNVCFETFYGGWQGLGFVSISAAEMNKYNGRNPKPEVSGRLGKILWNFRNTAWARYGLKSSPECVTLISKDLEHSEHPHYIDNMKDIRLAVSSAWDGCVQELSWHGMSIKDQVSAMARSVAVLTLPGSDCMNAVFLPDNATVVVPDRRANGVWQSSNEFRNWFKHADWLFFDHYRPHQDHLCDNTIRLDATDTLKRLLPGYEQHER